MTTRPPSEGDAPDESASRPSDAVPWTPGAPPPEGPDSGVSAERPRWVIPAGAAAAVCAGLAVLVLAGQHYLARGSWLCAQACHASTITAGAAVHRHPELDCEACHTVRPGTRLALTWAALTGQRDEATAHGPVDEQRCTDCHQQGVDDKWPFVAATRGHRAHASGPGKTGCLDCHAADEHQKGAVAQSCTECHSADRLHREVDGVVVGSADDPDRCLSCHGFATGLSAVVRPTVTECARCHGEDPPAAPAKGSTASAALVATSEILHGQVDCKLCHNPHGHDRQGEQGGHHCASCHDIETGNRDVVPAGHRVCESCHEPHAPHRDAVVSCEACHTEGVMSGQGDGADSVALQHDACSSCHLPHQWTAERAGCVKCHETEATVLLASAPAGHGQCVDCHEPHARSSAAVRCSRCHEGLKGHEAQAPPSHRDCAVCHEPHGSGSAASGGCQGCHGAAAKDLVSAGFPSHQKLGCRGCHGAHGSSTAGSDRCGSCHDAEQQASTSAASAEHQRCASCHPAHGFAVGSMESTCATCHRTVVAAGGAHQGDCQTCHVAHGSARVSDQACVGCHADQAPKATSKGAHAECGSCHQPHASAQGATGQCSSCHQKELQAAQAWRAGSPHRGSCQSCHPSHDVTAAASCASCHVAEGQQASKDGHRCSHCHGAHRPPPADAKQYWSDCESCHAAQARGARSRGATHRGCANCHQPHGFQSPGCTSASCHRDVRQLGAHATTEHQDCARCHDSHARVTVGRKQCLDCHTDLRDHEPDAPRCQACHPFK